MHSLLFKTQCPFCLLAHTVLVPIAQYREWRQGLPIQQAMPDLTPQERESLEMGVCACCWNEIWADTAPDPE